MPPALNCLAGTMAWPLATLIGWMTVPGVLFGTVPAYTLVYVGVRYRFRIGKAPATFRLQMQNVGDRFARNIVGSSSYGHMDKRRITAFLTADF